MRVLQLLPLLVFSCSLTARAGTLTWTVTGTQTGSTGPNGTPGPVGSIIGSAISSDQCPDAGSTLLLACPLVSVNITDAAFGIHVSITNPPLCSVASGVGWCYNGQGVGVYYTQQWALVATFYYFYSNGDYYVLTTPLINSIPSYTSSYYAARACNSYEIPPCYSVATAYGSYVLVGTPLPAPTALDPVPQLLNGPQITTSRSTLASSGRPVMGIAADGISQVVLRIPTVSPGGTVFAYMLTGPCGNQSDITTCPISQAPDDNGGLFTVGTAVTPSALSVASVASDTADSTGRAFIAYRAPIDFVRPAFQMSDSGLASRTAYILIVYTAVDRFQYATQYVPLTILRPPVVLVSGLWATAENWQTGGDLRALGSGLYSDGRFAVRASNYGSQSLQIYNVAPDGGVLQAYGNSLGIAFGANYLAAETHNFIADFASGDNDVAAPVAAIQADFVAHSMGSLVTRQLEHLIGFQSSQNFNQGYIHKVISVAGPHLGSPIALHLPDPSDEGVRLFNPHDTITLYGLTPTECLSSTDPSCKSGAIGDLAGAGDGTALSKALLTLRQGGTLSIAYITGEMNAQELAALSGYAQAPPGSDYEYSFNNGRYIRVQTLLDDIKGLIGPPFWPAPELANYLYTATFPILMGGQKSDGLVPVSSQTNGQSKYYDLSAATGNGLVHSEGAVTLGFGVIDTSPPTSILTMLDQDCENEVVQLLNTNVSNLVYVKNQ